MLKWILHVPIAGEDGDTTIPYLKRDESELDGVVDAFVRYTEIGVWVEWV